MPTTKGKNAEDFVKRHSQSYIVPEKIKAGLAQLGDTWEYETEFAKRCGLGPGQFAPYREQFAAFIVDLPRSKAQRNQRAWAGTAKFAAKIRELQN